MNYPDFNVEQLQAIERFQKARRDYWSHKLIREQRQAARVYSLSLYRARRAQVQS